MNWTWGAIIKEKIKFHTRDLLELSREEEATQLTPGEFAKNMFA